MIMGFSHIDKNANISMVDISDKKSSLRIAKAQAFVKMESYIIDQIYDDDITKGNVIATAKIAGINAAKQTAELIPLCHRINLSFIDIEIGRECDDTLKIICTVKCKEATGVEMEALTGVTVASLTIYDMCKSFNKNIVITEAKLVYKEGGKSGVYNG